MSNFPLGPETNNWNAHPKAALGVLLAIEDVFAGAPWRDSWDETVDKNYAAARLLLANIKLAGFPMPTNPEFLILFAMRAQRLVGRVLP